MSLTGVKDVDMEIILQLEDTELPRVCAVNKYVNEICQSDAFWYKRLINRIAKVRDINLSNYKGLKIIDINGERIREMQRFFGFKNLKGLNSYLNELHPNAAYLLYFVSPSFFDRQIRLTYPGFNENELPKYINREELLYEMRRQVAKAHYTLTNDRRINNHSFQFNIIPTPLMLPVEGYTTYKKIMGL